MRWPLDSFTITQGFSAGHTANDLAVPEGTPIKAPTAGVIDGRGEDVNYLGGKFVTMRGNNGYRFYMGHNSRNIFNPGQRVNEGDVIAYSGQTAGWKPVGFGPHVHFQIWDATGKLVDPSKQSLTRGGVPQPQGDDMIDRGTIFNMYYEMLGRAPEPGLIESRLAKKQSVHDVWYEIKDSPEYKARMAAFNAKASAYDGLAAQVNELSSRPTKDELAKVTDQLSKEKEAIAKLEAELKEATDKAVSDEEAAEYVAKKANPLFQFVTNVFKKLRG